MNNNLTGYGPSKRLYFDGDEEKYEIWEVKLLAHLRLKKLISVLEANEASEVPAERNAELFAELVQLLDDKSISLVMRDAKDNGREAMKILRDYYLGSSKPRIIALYTELTSLQMSASESVTDYMLRAETSATSLKGAGESISDSLLVAMVLKGLPEEFKAFSTVITQKKEEVKFSDFKCALRSYEENEKCRSVKNENDSVLKVNSSPRYNSNSQVKCFACGKLGHKKFQCPSRGSQNKGKPPRWCDICKNSTHDTNYCRKQNSAKAVTTTKICNNNEETETYAFK